MTQRIDWEALGKAAGEAEKNRSWGLRAQRPANWKPGTRFLPPGALPGKPNDAQTRRSHQQSKKTRNEQSLARKLDQVLGTEDE